MGDDKTDLETLNEQRRNRCFSAPRLRVRALRDDVPEILEDVKAVPENSQENFM